MHYLPVKFSFFSAIVCSAMAFSCLPLQAAAPIKSSGNNFVKESKAKTDKAIAIISPAKGSTVKGIVNFTSVEGGVKIVADLEGLKPGKHGFHIHEYGDCSAPDFSSAGNHFNPNKGKHAGPDDPYRHAGDLGNLEAESDGKAHFEWVDNLITLDGENGIVGKSVVVHADPDDFHTQPSGASGAKIGCGVIQAVATE